MAGVFNFNKAMSCSIGLSTEKKLERKYQYNNKNEHERTFQNQSEETV